MRIFCQADLVRPSATQFATNYITINNILNKKAELRQLFTSEEWYNSRFSESEEGKIIESRVLDHRFWDAMERVQSINEPLCSILRIVDTEVVPTMPILYDMFHIMKEKISKLKGKKWLLKIINHKWDVTLSRPLHQA
ncbi:PREDICTED: LOC109939386 isoform, partial [Prunus dulcis]